MPECDRQSPRPRRPLVVGVTGGIGAGKSSFCRQMVACGGVAHLDADAIVHELLAGDEAVRRAIREAFGAEILGRDGRVDRGALAARVFADRAARHALERIVHPVVRALLQERLERLRCRAEIAIVLVEIPLLVEAGRPPWIDRVVTIEAPVELRRARLAEKGFSQAEISHRLAAQTSREQRVRRADEVIENAGDPATLAAAARGRWQAWQSG